MSTKHRTDSRQSKLTEKRAKFYSHRDIWADLKADVARASREFWRSRGMDEPLAVSLTTFGRDRRDENE